MIFNVALPGDFWNDGLLCSMYDISFQIIGSKLLGGAMGVQANGAGQNNRSEGS
jgi:hypothetical protein